MYVTDKFVFLHVPKTAGTTVMRSLLPAMSRGRYGMYLKRYENHYHKHMQFMEDKYRHLPRIGFTRNPWAWYPSWMGWAMTIGDQPTLRVFSQGLDPKSPLFFTDTIKRILSVDDGTDSSKKYIQAMEAFYKNVGYRSARFMTPYNYAHYAKDFGAGYFTWWYRSILYGIFNPEPNDSVEIGRVENFTDDFLRLTGNHTELTPEYITYVKQGQAERVRNTKYPYQDHYDFELAALVAKKDGGIINKFGYQFNQEEKLA